MKTQNEQKAKEIAHEYFRKGQLGLVPCDTENAGYDCAIQAMEWQEQQMIKRTIDWVQKEATKHIGFNAISEECSLSWDFIDLLVKAMKGE